MCKRRLRFPESAMAITALAFSSCSGSAGGAGDDGGTGGSNAGTDSNVQGDTFSILGGGKDGAADGPNCTPFSPPIPCAQGTTCPAESYCDLKQAPPMCAKLHCGASGAACDTGGYVCNGGSTWSPLSPCPGSEYCVSNLCLAGVCASPVGEGSPCNNQFCDQSLLCLGYPPTCVKPRGIGGACLDDNWCASSLASSAIMANTVYCLAGVCGQSYCNSATTSATCGTSANCPPGYDCLGQSAASPGFCVQLYCGQDGIPCSSDTHCASGFGCVISHCRKLNVPLHCAGTPASADCSVVSSLMPTLGCSVAASVCSGTATACSTHQFATGGSGACSGQSGCSWDTSSQRCVGTPVSCNQLTAASGYCTQYNGCTLSETGTGSPTPCSQLSTSECASQFGCKVTDIGIY